MCFCLYRYLGTLPRTLPALDNPKRGISIQKEIVFGPGRLAKFHVRIESLFEFNTTEVMITIRGALVASSEVLNLMEDIMRSNQLTLDYVDVKMQLYYRTLATMKYGHFLEFAPSWLKELSLEEYLDTCCITVKDHVLNGDVDHLELLLEEAYLEPQDVDDMYLCPCALPKKSHDAWLEHDFCITHLDFQP